MARKVETLARFDPEKLAELKKISERLRVSQAELLRIALDWLIERYGDAEFGDKIP